MKISVCGKGGSGKSVLTALMSGVLSSRNYSVVVLDTDESNVGLHRMMQVDTCAVPIMTAMGGKTVVKEKLRSAMAQQTEETDINVLSKSTIEIDSLPSDCVAEAGGIRLLSVGKIERSMEGCACPMGVLARDLVTKLVLLDREVLLIDTEAGVEHFGRGVESSVDTILIMVDPSFESILLAEKIHGLANEMGVKATAILNKVTSQTEHTIREEIEKKGLPISGSVPYDQAVFNACLTGQAIKSVSVEKHVADIAESLGLKA